MQVFRFCLESVGLLPDRKSECGAVENYPLFGRFGIFHAKPHAEIDKVYNDRCPEKQVRFLCGSATVMRRVRSVGSPALSWKYGSTRMDEYRDDTFFPVGVCLFLRKSAHQFQAKGGWYI